MVSSNALFILVDLLFVVIAAYFGLQAVKTWKKCPSEDIIKLMSDRPTYRMRLFYSALFLGVMMATLSVVHGLGYVSELNTSGVDTLLTSLLFLSIVILTHSWYIFLEGCCSLE